MAVSKFTTESRLWRNIVRAFAAILAHSNYTLVLDAALRVPTTGDYRRDLVAMGSQVLALMMARRDAMRLLLCEAEHFSEVGEVLAQNPRRLRQVLAAYLEEQMALGRVRKLHAEAVAQAFWGMFFAFSVSVWLPAMPPMLATMGISTASAA